VCASQSCSSYHNAHFSIQKQVNRDLFPTTVKAQHLLKTQAKRVFLSFGFRHLEFVRCDYKYLEVKNEDNT
jgi:hypothetical protein